MKLYQAFGVQRGDVVSFIGAGGKTSALVGLGYELSELGWRVLATTTTSLTLDQLSIMPHVEHSSIDHVSLSKALDEHSFVFLYEQQRGNHVSGVSAATIWQLLDQVDSDVLLVEADRANGLPLKAPYADEPVIPPETSLVVPVASLAALDQPLDNAHIYNAQAMIDKFGFYPGSHVRSPWIAQVLRDETLGLQGVPDEARVIAFINQTPTQGYLRGRSRRIAKLILKTPRVEGVAIGAVRAADPVCEVQRPTGVIILADGQSSQFGQPKMLLPWSNNKTILEHIIEQLIRTRVEPIIVVTGYDAAVIKRHVKPLGVTVVHNRRYKSGNMITGIQAGLSAMPAHIAATMILRGDQPRLQASVLFQLLGEFAEGSGDLLVPSYQGLAGYPMIVPRKYWGAFMEMPRQQVMLDFLDEQQPVLAMVDVNTDTILDHIDTPGDYERARRLAGLRQIKLDYRKPDAS